MKVLETAEVPLAKLKPTPGNPRTHHLPTIRESLERNGQYRTVVVRKRGMQILAGHGTCEAAAELGWTTIRAELIDCTPTEAKRIVLVDNRAPDLGMYDDQALAAFLDGLKDDDLIGTGYDSHDVEQLLLLTGGDPGALQGAPSRPPGVAPYATGEAEVFRFILLYDRETYEAMVNRLDALMDEHDLDSYSAVIEHLVRA